ncbi:MULTISPECIES: transcription antitermination factor NusB [Desulfococcus]|jgi:N utilization substance protein B|uniref:Transcription antitermination protein NusB n=1 Tax=Desulfococcus multivorans DSM 2059 TaxID=1121405 RepID=S7U0T8_DESML|nr:transcription antitermination factor NusB [Desulfococcus multivorans]AOY58319.1 NusB: transcription antitermination factor B [Desulfococcus multivorans]AQV00654.1 N utilization substance protein B [Desulfococcus multivorans]EPR42605.1 NusB antitermination factor [Desulfococcus multivorans DSM 2059]MDX9818436.1 transcription antitermination factor NusB [Desulfococcus multivorans]SKA17985.1 NusB antitermination factor [Desulfococcus multivorans DSM 2059]
MKNRRKSREAALQALYYMDIRNDISIEALTLFQRCFPQSEKIQPFFETLARGVMLNRCQIDRLIERFSSNWKISRMACVDRNVMRIALYEILFLEDIPEKVSINEAIDIGKKYGTEESGAFINGILDSAHIALKNQEIQVEAECRSAIPDRIPSVGDGIGKTDEKAEVASFSPVRGRPGVVKRRASTTTPIHDETEND